MKDRVVFGLIGTGAIARSQHLPNLDRSPRAVLKTVCDLRQDVLDTVRAKYRIPVSTADYRDILGDPEVDAVMIATKDDMQAPLTVEALRAGKHVYVEKPLASTIEECEEVDRVQRETGRYVAVGYNRRFAPAYIKAKEVIDADGGPKNIHYRISSRYHNWGPPRQQVILEACHVFDIIRWFTGSDAVSVYTIESRDDDEVHVIKMESGCVVSITSSNYVSFDMPKERIELFGEQGGAVVEDFTELRTYGYPAYDHAYTFEGHSHPDREFIHKYLLKGMGAQALHGIRRACWEIEQKVGGSSDTAPAGLEEEYAYHFGRRPAAYMVDKGWRPALEHFCECILTGTPPDTAGAADGLAASRMEHAAIESRNTGRVITL